MNLLLHELKINNRSIITWSLTLALVAAFFLAIYPSYTKDVEAVKQLMENFPPAFRKAFSLDLDIFFSLFGFYSYTMTFLVLAGAVQSMNLGVGMLSKESTDKTVDFLLSKPISRMQIITSKLLASILMLIITNIIFVLTVFVVSYVVTNGDLDQKVLLLLSGILLLVQLIFFSLGFLISANAQKIKSVVSVSLPIVFGFYIIGVLDSVFDAEKLQYLTPLKYFESRYIIENGRYETQFLLLSAFIIVISIISSCLIYKRKDIDAVT